MKREKLASVKPVEEPSKDKRKRRKLTRATKEPRGGFTT